MAACIFFKFNYSYINRGKLKVFIIKGLSTKINLKFLKCSYKIKMFQPSRSFSPSVCNILPNTFFSMMCFNEKNKVPKVWANLVASIKSYLNIRLKMSLSYVSQPYAKIKNPIRITDRIYFYTCSSTIKNFRSLNLEKHKNTKKFETKR